jgi:hypothetical protein
MLTLLLISVFGGGSVDCGSDLKCFEARADKCEPAVARVAVSAPIEAGHPSLTGERFGTYFATLTLVVDGPRIGGCEITRDLVIERAEWLRPDGGVSEQLQRERDEHLTRRSRELNDTIGMRQRCTLPKSQLPAWIEAHLTANPVDDLHCANATCGKEPPLALGCAVTGCDGGTWAIDCAGSKCAVPVGEFREKEREIHCGRAGTVPTCPTAKPHGIE